MLFTVTVSDNKDSCIPWYTSRVQPFAKQTLVSTSLQYKSFENTVGKGENCS